ncbi:MAG: hypothetical protein KAH32_08005 [Chlamydiia bacterium]|nr:hypothetical protein [Chlamydiia bacterium]
MRKIILSIAVFAALFTTEAISQTNSGHLYEHNIVKEDLHVLVRMEFRDKCEGLLEVQYKVFIGKDLVDIRRQATEYCESVDFYVHNTWEFTLVC